MGPLLNLPAAAGSFFIAFLVTAAFVPFVRWSAVKYGWLDRPDGDRKVHKISTPTAGGIGIAAGCLAGALFLWLAGDAFGVAVSLPRPVWVGALLLLATGLYDDVYGLNFKIKFVAQIAAAFLLLHAGYRFDINDILFLEIDPYLEILYSVPLTILWVVGLINAVNLIDGLDGLAAGVVMIGFAVLATLFGLNGDIHHALFAAIMIGAISGFLAYNFNPASIFMGDSGSLFLGYMLATYSLQGTVHANSFVALFTLVVALGVLFLDTGLAVLRRMVGGKALFMADRDHIHHRLIQFLPESLTVTVLYGAEVAFGTAAVFMATSEPTQALFIFGVVGFGACVGLGFLGYLPVRLPGYRHPQVDHPLASVGQGTNGEHSSVPVDVDTMDVDVEEEIAYDREQSPQRVGANVGESTSREYESLHVSKQ